jgi:poly(3-hydroxybutyrate) depolymerase
MKFKLFFIAIFFVLSVGGFGQEIIQGKLTYGGLERVFATYLPANHSNVVLLALHGCGGTARGLINDMGLVSMADKNGTVIVAAEGYNLAGPEWPYYQRSWNAYHCCEDSYRDNVDDVGFLSYLLDYIQYTYGCNRVIGLGFSNGAMMLHRFAGETDRMSAFAAISGTIGGKAYRYPQVRMPDYRTRNVSGLMVHGMMDDTVLYDEDWEASSRNRQDISFQDGVRFWRESCGYDVEEACSDEYPAPQKGEVKNYKSSKVSPWSAHVDRMRTIVFPNGTHVYLPWSWVMDQAWSFLHCHKN